MARQRTFYSCTDCGTHAVQWAGRCPGCGAWNTLQEEVEAARNEPIASVAAAAMPITEVDPRQWRPAPTGVAELDRVLGGGLVDGSVTLLGGEPGIGKSTLLLQAAASVARGGQRVLYISGEESAAQVQGRAARVDALVEGLWFSSESDVHAVIALIERHDPSLVVVDSIQTTLDPSLGATPGTVTQVRGCALQLIDVTKRRQTATVLVGHVTKDGELAGPRVLEHAVDTVLAFSGDRHHALRLLRAVKHRFASTDELGLFEMTESGMIGVPDPSALFLADRRAGVPGSVVVPTLDGHRPLLVEIQALVASAGPGGPRRSAQGIDPGRLALLVAVLEQRVGLPLAGLDVYVSVVGGVRVSEPGSDLGIALALVSAVRDRPLPDDLVALGEVGLAGELRQVSQTPRRVSEATRLGFGRILLPESAPRDDVHAPTLRAATLGEALEVAGLGLAIVGTQALG
ncbi:MAG TPA: DNA repair protein RadA [Acidimicrobiales bacterium]|nr:DNA repair protein RadA [Acidimicrobiales bacterium]